MSKRRGEGRGEEGKRKGRKGSKERGGRTKKTSCAPPTFNPGYASGGRS